MAGMNKATLVAGGLALVGVAGFLALRANAAPGLPTGPIPVEDINAGRDFPGYVTGSAEAPLEIVEYADFQCPACQHYWLVTVRDVKQRLVAGGKVRYAFRDFPLEIHDKARAAHHAAACADEQGRFEPMHDQLFANQGQWSAAAGGGEGLFREYAATAGLDLAAYDECMRSGRFRGRIQASFEGGIALGVSSTPTFVIDGKLYTGLAYDQMAALVDSLIAGRP